MPIGIHYEPSAGSVYDAALIAGLGDWRQRQQQMALQQQQMAQQAQFHQDSLAANVYGQNLNFAGDMQRLAAANQQRGQDQQFDAAKTVFENQQQAARQANLFNQQAGRDDQLANRQEAHDARMAQSGMAEAKMRWAQAGVARGDFYYDDAQKMKMAELNSQMTKVRTKEDWNDQDIENGVAQLQKQYDKIASNPVPKREDEKDVPYHEQVKEKIAMMDRRGNTYPAGTNDPSLGELFPVTPDRSGVTSGVRGWKPAEPDQQMKAWEEFKKRHDGMMVDEGFVDGKPSKRPITGKELHDKWLENLKADELEAQRRADPGAFVSGQAQQPPPPPEQAPPQPTTPVSTAPQSPQPGSLETTPVNQGPPQQQPTAPQQRALTKPRTAREALTAVSDAQNSIDGWRGIPTGAGLTEEKAQQYLNSPAAKAVMARSGIVPPAGGPPPAPPLKIEANEAGDKQLRELLADHPEGIVVIDGRTGKPVFISAAMLQKQ